jgi:hypothetical protein
VVVDDRVCFAAPPLVDLGEVLDDRHELEPLAGTGGGDLIEVGKRRDIRRLVEHEEQRALDRPAGGPARA